MHHRRFSGLARLIIRSFAPVKQRGATALNKGRDEGCFIFRIIRGGENISPGEIADAVAQLPGVADVKVLGVAHEVLGEEIAAAIVLKKGSAFDEDAAKKTLAEKLAKYKIPAYFVILDKFPLLGSGKIDAITLKKDVLSKLNKG